MASGQFAVSTSNSYISGKVTWSSTKDVANNRSTVTATMYLSRTNTGYTTYGSGSYTLNIGGSSDTESGSKTITYNSNTVMVTHSAVINHDADGGKEITISWSGSMSGVFTVTSSSGKAVLDTIPRASSLTSSANWTAGSNLGVSIDRASSSFVHSVYVYVNGVLIDNKGDIGTSTTFSWTLAENTSIFNQLNGAATEDTKILLITYEYSGGSEIGRKEYTGTVTAPAASTVTSGTDRYRYIDEDFIVGISRAHSSFTHTVEIHFGTLKFYRYDVTTSVTFTWTQAEKDQLYAQIPNAKLGSGAIYITTYYNGEKVRAYTSIGMELHVRNSEPVFTTFTYTDTNSAMNTLKGAGNEKTMIQGKSTLVATVTNANKAVAKNGSSISKYVLTLEGATITDDTPFSTDITFTYGAIQASTNQTLSIKAYDSRGFYTEVKYTVTVVPYSIPVIKTSAARTNGFENETTLNLNGSISPVSVGGVNKNSLKAAASYYRWRQKGTSTWSTGVSYSGFTLTMPNYTTTPMLVNGATGLDNNFAWEIEVTVADQLGSNAVILQVVAGKPIMMWDDVKKAVGVNKFPGINNGFDVSGEIRSDLQATVSNPLNPAATLHIGWKDDVARIRYGGSGLGSQNGFQIQGTGDVVKFSVSDSGALLAPGGFTPIRIYGTENIDDVTNPGLYYCPLSADAQSMLGNVPTSAAFSLFVEKHAGYKQTLTEYGTGLARTYTRNKYSTTWGAWKYVGSYDYGSNSNGAYIRFQDGTQICWQRITTTSVGLTSAYGADATVKEYHGTYTWTYPAAFSDTPVVQCSEFKWGTGASWGSVSSVPTTTAAVLRGHDMYSRAAGTNVYISSIAIGRWA